MIKWFAKVLLRRKFRAFVEMKTSFHFSHFRMKLIFTWMKKLIEIILGTGRKKTQARSVRKVFIHHAINYSFIHSLSGLGLPFRNVEITVLSSSTKMLPVNHTFKCLSNHFFKLDSSMGTSDQIHIYCTQNY